jgi:small multidrug resistance family-3 protein
MTRTAVAYIGAALAEIAGCFSFWMWLRDSKPACGLSKEFGLIGGMCWVL